MFAHVCNSLGPRFRRPGCYRLLCNTTLTARLSRSFYYKAYASFFSVSRGGPRAGRSGPCALPLHFAGVPQGDFWLLLARARGLLPVPLSKPHNHSKSPVCINSGEGLAFLQFCRQATEEFVCLRGKIHSLPFVSRLLQDLPSFSKSPDQFFRGWCWVHHPAAGCDIGHSWSITISHMYRPGYRIIL